ncbi:hypothetical protein [Armatimonas sp.]|uniref:hypothetical protein n=1 Tax=Armatimonas sp. TaxID=1872638 RepID=UPI003751678D
MQRRKLLKLALALPLAGCGSGWNLGFGPIRGGGSSTTTTQQSTGRVILPTGSPLNLGQLSLLSGYTAAALKGDGNFTLGQFNATPALLLLTDKDKRLVLLGFSGSTASGMVGEVSPLQTSVALLFYAVGAFTLPTEAQEQVRKFLRDDEGVKVLASQLTTQLAANPYALADTDPTLMSAVTAVRDALFPPSTRAVITRHRDEPLATTLIQTKPENEQSGFLAAPNANGLGMTITNTRRRNAIVNIYQSAYYTEASKDPVPVPDSKYHRVIYSEILWGTSGLSGVAGSLIDYANGTVAYGPVTSGPYSLDLYPAGATKATYRVEIIANGNTGDPNNLTGTAKPLPGELTPVGAHLKISFITFFKDFLLPAIATFIGLQESLKLDLVGGQGLPSTDLLKNFDDLAVIFSGVVDSGIAISASNARGLLITVLKALANNGTLRQKFIEWMVVVFARQGFTAGVAATLLGTLATALNAIVIIVDKVLGAADIGAVLADWTRSDSYLLFEANVIAPKVKLSPQTATITAGDSLTLKATVAVDAPLITYHWRIVRGSGTLKNPVNGLTGVSLDSASQDMIYQSDANATDKATVTIELEGFVGSVNDPNRMSLGTATTTITVNPRTVSIAPASMTISPGDTLSLSASLSGTYPGSLRYLWTLGGGGSEASLSDSGGHLGSSFESAQSTVKLTTGAATQGTVTVGVEVVGVTPDGTRTSLGSAVGTVNVNDNIPFGSVRIVFDGKTRILPQSSVQRLSGTTGLALGALYQRVSAEYGGLVGLKLILQFSTPTVAVGSIARVVSDYDLTYELPEGNTSLYFAPSAPGTLTVTEVGSGYFGYTLSVNLKGLRGVPTTGPAVFKGWVTSY